MVVDMKETRRKTKDMVEVLSGDQMESIMKGNGEQIEGMDKVVNTLRIIYLYIKVIGKMINIMGLEYSIIVRWRLGEQIIMIWE